MIRKLRRRIFQIRRQWDRRRVQAALRDAPPLTPSGEGSFVLYRILGNDVRHRHAESQTLTNLRFLLRNEPPLERCTKRFVLNRIVDREAEARLVELLDAAGFGWLRIPFDADEFRAIEPEDHSVHDDYVARLSREDPLVGMRQMNARYRPYNRYLMNNNGARNAALADGRGYADWVMPWDGNCFLTAGAWEEIMASVDRTPQAAYHIVPMARLTDNAMLLSDGPRPPADEEPQILFHRTAAETFDERFVYGRRPKVELLARLGVEGPWFDWQDDPWDLAPGPAAADRYLYNAPCGWVARMASGSAAQERGRDGRSARLLARSRGIVAQIEAHLPPERRLSGPSHAG